MKKFIASWKKASYHASCWSKVWLTQNSLFRALVCVCECVCECMSLSLSLTHASVSRGKSSYDFLLTVSFTSFANPAKPPPVSAIGRSCLFFECKIILFCLLLAFALLLQLSTLTLNFALTDLNYRIILNCIKISVVFVGCGCF